MHFVFLAVNHVIIIMKQMAFAIKQNSLKKYIAKTSWYKDNFHNKWIKNTFALKKRAASCRCKGQIVNLCINKTDVIHLHICADFNFKHISCGLVVTDNSPNDSFICCTALLLTYSYTIFQILSHFIHDCILQFCLQSALLL